MKFDIDRCQYEGIHGDAIHWHLFSHVKCNPNLSQALKIQAINLAYIMQPQGNEIYYALMQDGDNDELANMAEEELAYMQPGGDMAEEELAYIMQQLEGGEINYRQRALMQDGDSDVGQLDRQTTEKGHKTS